LLPRARACPRAAGLAALALLAGCGAAPAPPRTAAPATAAQAPAKPASAAVGHWKRQSGGVLRASYAQLRADEGGVGAAVLVAEGVALSAADSGWVAPDEPLEPAPRTIRRPRVVPVIARPAVVVEPVDLGKLERIVVPAPFGSDELAAIAEAGFTGLGVRGAPWLKREDASGNVITFRIRAEPSALSHMHIGSIRGGGGWTADNEHAVHVSCRPQMLEALTAARWQTATPRAEGLEVAIHDGWFQESRCRAGLVRSVVATARPIDSAGLVHGLRVCESEACRAPGLLLVLPRASSAVVSGAGAWSDTGGATFVRLSLLGGTGSTALARITMSSLVEWERSRVRVGLPSRIEALGSNLPASVQVGVDISAAVSDETPQVVVYRNRVEPFAR
jgi:hypothetical protein